MAGGGNAASDPMITIRRHAALGDTLAATVVADKLCERGYQVRFQSHPASHCLLRRVRSITSIAESGGYADINLDQTYEIDPHRRSRHFSEIFMGSANQQLLHRGIVLGPPLNCRPSLMVAFHEKEAVSAKFNDYPKPHVFICPRSDSYNVRQVPDGIWQSAASKIPGTKFWLGRHPAPPGIVDLHCQHVDNLILYLSVADVLVSVDTGPLHLAAALGVPIVAIGQSSSPELHLSDQRDFITVEPKLTCLNCQTNLCPINQWSPPCQQIDPDFIAAWVNAKLRGITGNDTSAIIPIYKPEVEVLNRCISQVIEQVQEVIVSCQADSVVPCGAMENSKIRYVRHRLPELGYGRNTNFGTRNSVGKWLLLLNDDVFLEPDAVERMMSEMKPGVGAVSQFLRYPEGTIYHAGKTRTTGERGWGHLDHRKYEPSIKEPREMENMNLASCLVRREAFYQIGGFDETFRLYAEDDDFCLSMRKAGWRLVYTPHAKGIHMEHQSTRKVDNIMTLVSNANKRFGEKWDDYLTHNANKIPGTFDY